MGMDLMEEQPNSSNGFRPVSSDFSPSSTESSLSLLVLKKLFKFLFASSPSLKIPWLL
jgi:hypothetical protein